MRDARIFQNSYLGSNYEAVLSQYDTTALSSRDTAVENIPAFILRDSAYPNTRHLVTTYKVTECENDSSVRHLNQRLSKARYHVEHAFGLLKGQFQIFAKPLRSAFEDYLFAMHLIASFFVLHNFLIDTRDTVSEHDVLPPEIAKQVQQYESGMGGELGRNELNEIEDEADEDIAARAGQNNSCGSTRNALLRHIRWLDEVP